MNLALSVNFLWNFVVLDLHVLEPLHGRSIVKVGDVGGDKLCARGGDHAVEEELGCGEARARGGGFARVVECVAADSEAD